MYQQAYDPVASSLALSALVAAIPILVLFVLLAGIRARRSAQTLRNAPIPASRKTGATAVWMISAT